MRDIEERRDCWLSTLILCLVVLVAFLFFTLFQIGQVQARDDGRYAGSPLKRWFDSLASGNGPCCSDADGTALSDVDWQSLDGHYRVKIDGKWWNVPDEAVLKGPNLVGRTMVWPVRYNSLGSELRIEIRCFLPGAMI